MARKRDQTGANHFKWPYVAPRRLMRLVIMGRHQLEQHLGDQALGSQLKLSQTIRRLRRRGCRVWDLCLRPRDWVGTR